MAHIIFDFNNTKFRIQKTDAEVEKIFEDITGIKIERKIIQEAKKQIEEIEKPIFSEKAKARKHPSVEELIDLFKKSNFEFRSELVRETFYPNLSLEDWRKAFSIIYTKIKKAMKSIEEQERGHFEKRKEGKYTFYHFVKDNIPPLSEYGT